MTAPPPTSLGPYQIVSAIGKGGMGEVWRARDPRLGRDVAIKISAQQFTDRFERKARAIAALNHPNICTLFDVGPNYLVMELVEGPTLAEQIREGPVPIDEALAIAKQIADALEAAHEKGIVHRDLKPANIKIKPDGSVKVLDFGLAKAGGAAELTADSPTMLSVAGMILGTAGYMAPEQARGKDVDKRADIWSFGVVLHEMLTGRRLFQGEDLTETLAAVVKTEPDLSDVPAQVKRLLTKCLQKDPKKRLRDIGDWRELLDTGQPGATPSRSRFGMMSWLAGVFAAGLAVVSFIHFRETSPGAPRIVSSIPPAESTTFDFAVSLNPPELSPDGKWIVFGARTADNKNPLWIRSLASTTLQVLPGTDHARFPFWSPDSRSVAFFADGKLKRIDISGGPALALADIVDFARGGSWSPLGIILFAAENGPVLRIAASGGSPSPATFPEHTKSLDHRFPWFLPDGRHFLFVDRLSAVDASLRIGALDSQDSALLGVMDSNAVYAAGHILFLRESTLMAQPFDAGAGVLKGEAVPVAEQVSAVLAGRIRKGVFTVSQSGLLTYYTGKSGTNRSLSWSDRSGKVLGVLGQAADYRALELSPDGKSAAVVAQDTGGNVDIWTHDMARDLRTRFTFDPDVDQQPVWSPDGATIAWRRKGTHDGMYRRAASGQGKEELLYTGAGLGDVSSWSQDGRFLLFHRISSGTGFGVWSLPLTPEQRGKPLQPASVADTPSSEQWGRFSPDGRWVAYVSSESQRDEVYVIPFPGAGGKRQISNAGGDLPRWRRDGKEIFYRGLDGGLMAAEMTFKAGSLETGPVRSLGITVSLTNEGYLYDVSPDGQRILAISAPVSAASQPLTLVQNWTAGLRK